MKTSQFKDLIKEAVREAIKEELKDILLEAIKTPKQTIVTESVIPIKKQLDPVEARNKYMNLLGDMAAGKDTISLNTNTFPMGPVDNENGSLPNGELPLDMIAGLLTKK